MSGRGGGRSTSKDQRTGCGCRRFNTRRNNNPRNGKQVELKFAPHGSGRNQNIAMFVTVRDHIIHDV